MVHRRRSRGDVTFSQTVDVTAVIEFGGTPKNKIHGASNITILVIVPPPITKDGVLPSEEPAVTEDEPVAIQPHRQRLALGTGGVLKRKVLCHKIVRIDHGRRCAESGEGLAVRTGKVRMQIVGQNG